MTALFIYIITGTRPSVTKVCTEKESVDMATRWTLSWRPDGRCQLDNG